MRYKSKMREQVFKTFLKEFPNTRQLFELEMIDEKKVMCYYIKRDYEKRCKDLNRSGFDADGNNGMTKIQIQLSVNYDVSRRTIRDAIYLNA